MADEAAASKLTLVGPGGGASDSPEDIKVPILGTTRNIWLFGLFYFCFGLGLGTQYSMASVWYIEWGLGTVWIGVSSTLIILSLTYASIAVSYFGDRLKGKDGRRKPMIRIGYYICCIAIVAGALPPSHDPIILAGWFVLTQNLYSAGATAIVLISTTSWLIESSADSQDYSRILSLAFNLGMLPGALFGLVLGIIAGPVVGAFLFVIAGGLAVWAVTTKIPNRILAKVERQPDLIPSFRSCVRTQEFRTIFANRCCINLGNMIGTNLGIILIEVGYAKTIAQVSNYLILTAFGIVILGVVFNIIVWQIVSRYDKVMVYQHLTIGIAGLCVCGFVLSLFGEATPFLIYVVLIGGIFYPVQLIDGFFVRDLVSADTLLTGLNRENLYQVAIEAPSQMVANFLGAVPLVIVYSSGFSVKSDPSGDDDQVATHYSWNSAVIWEVRVISTLVVGVVALVAFYTLSGYPINDYVAKQVSLMLNDKNERKHAIQEDAIKAERGDEFCFGADDDIDLSRLDESLAEEFGSVADDKDYVMMMHFSALEVDCLANDKDGGGADGVSVLERIHRANMIGLVLGAVTTTLVLVGLFMQLIAQSFVLPMLLSMGLIAASIYTLYEGIRHGVIQKLRELSAGEMLAKASAASSKNHAFVETVSDVLCKGAGTDRSENTNTTGTEPMKQLNTPLGSLNNGPDADKVLELTGYKRIYAGLCVILAVSVVGIVFGG
jgi:MFS family permease